MNKRILYALILIGAVVVVLIFNTDDNMTIHIIFTKLKAIKSLVLFAFAGVGVVIGILVK